jgi:transposase
MNKFTNTIGIDVAKDKLDAHDYKLNKHHLFKNGLEGFKQLLAWARNNHGSQGESILFCFENTGIYSLALAVFIQENQLLYSCVPSLEIKRSMGITRGKNDKIDAYKIAEYAYLRRELLKPTKLASNNLIQLKELLTIREKMVKHRGAYQSHLKGSSRFYTPEKYPKIFQSQERMIQELNKEIEVIEKEMRKIIEEDPSLKENYHLATSVKGIGLILGASFLVYSDNFTKFKTWRKMASYAGTAPFPYESGSSIKGRNKVNDMANKQIKALLSNAAASNIQYDPETRLYYEKKIKEGKNKMLVQNNIKNKIIARVFATVRRGTPYVNTLAYAA